MNLFKKYKFLFVISVIFVAVGVKMYLKSENLEGKKLRMAFPSMSELETYDPAKISFSNEYVLLENIFSSLVEIDKKGNIIPGVAESVEWEGDELRLDIRNNLKTASGNLITAQDAEFSLKRLLILASNTHGNFKTLVCPEINLKNVEEKCPGMRIVGNSLYIKTDKHKAFLLQMLASIDFAVIPKSSVDPKTLKIINYHETSGVYFVSKDNKNGHLELTMNSAHYHASPDIAHIVELIPIDSKIQGASLEALEKNKVDLLPTIDSRAEEILKFLKEKQNQFNVHATLKIKTNLLVFTEKGQQRFSQSERRAFAQKIRIAFREIYKNTDGFESRVEFFPSLSVGSLKDDQLIKIHEMNSEKLNLPEKSFRLGVIRRGDVETWKAEFQKVIPNLHFYKENNIPDFKKYDSQDEIPDAFISATDTGAIEDISLISYSLNSGLLGLTKSERQKWLEEYMSIENRSERIEKLRNLHFRALEGFVTVPLNASSYIAIARKPWKIELSDLYANNQLWLIKTH